MVTPAALTVTLPADVNVGPGSLVDDEDVRESVVDVDVVVGVRVEDDDLLHDCGRMISNWYSFDKGSPSSIKCNSRRQSRRTI